MKRTALFAIALSIVMLFALIAVVGCAGDDSTVEGGLGYDDRPLGLLSTYDDESGRGLAGRARVSAESDEIILEAAEVDAVLDSAPGSSPSALEDRMVIRSAEADIETKDFDASMTSIDAAVAAAGGFTQDSSLRGDGDVGNLRTYHAVLRIPQGNFDDFLQGMNEHGNVLNMTRAGDDVTDVFFDNEARIRILETEETELLELMSRADSLSDIFTIRDRISEVRTEIERLSGQNIRTENLVTLSTVTLWLTEVESITPPDDDDDEGFFARAAEVFTSSLDAFVAFVQGLAMVIIAMSPFLVTLLVVAAIIWLIVKRQLKKKKATQEALAQQYAEAAAASQAQAQTVHPEYADPTVDQQSVDQQTR